MPTSIDTEAQAINVAAIVEQIKPLLAGRDPSVQGAVLCELLSLWLAGHSPMIRKAMFAMHFKAVQEMIPISEKELFGDHGHPDRRKRQ